jgi:hypothetical protein
MLNVVFKLADFPLSGSDGQGQNRIVIDDA